jgi:hypothetical protein
MKFSGVYPMYIQKAERKNRTKEEVDHVICWLTGYGQAELQRQIELESPRPSAKTPLFNQSALLIKALCAAYAWKRLNPLMRRFATSTS